MKVKRKPKPTAEETPKVSWQHFKDDPRKITTLPEYGVRPHITVPLSDPVPTKKDTMYLTVQIWDNGGVEMFMWWNKVDNAKRIGPDCEMLFFMFRDISVAHAIKHCLGIPVTWEVHPGQELTGNFTWEKGNAKKKTKTKDKAKKNRRASKNKL